MERTVAVLRARSQKRRLLSLVAGLIVLLALWPGEALAGRRGIEVKIRLLDGGRVNGELIAVRTDTIIVKSAIIESTVAVAEIESIALPEDVGGTMIVKTLSIAAGIALGYVASNAYARRYSDEYDGIPFWAWPVGISGGALLGNAAGGWISKEGDKLYPIKGQSPETVARIMAKLKRKARLRVVS
jgi:hypothetical protein